MMDGIEENEPEKRSYWLLRREFAAVIELCGAVPRRLKPPRNHENEAWIGTSELMPFQILPCTLCPTKSTSTNGSAPTHFAEGPHFSQRTREMGHRAGGTPALPLLLLRLRND